MRFARVCRSLAWKFVGRFMSSLWECLHSSLRGLRRTPEDHRRVFRWSTEGFGGMADGSPV
eukprot:6915215-Alexandrium_andersonii.AAC.1